MPTCSCGGSVSRPCAAGSSAGMVPAVNSWQVASLRWRWVLINTLAAHSRAGRGGRGPIRGADEAPVSTPTTRANSGLPPVKRA
eukprot:3555230-Pyramimonas_sp.AAC.2